MPTVKVTWDKRPVVNHVYGAAQRTMKRIGAQAQIWWFAVAPVGKDTKDHRAGELRDSWFVLPANGRMYIGILFGARAPYALYVELGTEKMPVPRAPIRTVAGEAYAFIESYFAQELS